MLDNIIEGIISLILSNKFDLQIWYWKKNIWLGSMNYNCSIWHPKRQLANQISDLFFWKKPTQIKSVQRNLTSNPIWDQKFLPSFEVMVWLFWCLVGIFYFWSHFMKTLIQMFKVCSRFMLDLVYNTVKVDDLLAKPVADGDWMQACPLPKAA